MGEGSFGHVRIGWWQETEVAVKVLHAHCHEPAAAAGSLDSAAGAASGGGESGDADGGGEGGGEGARWDEARLRALSREVDILANLRHPNVVMFLGVVLRPPCVVTEYCSLGSLYDVLRKARRDAAFGARLTWPRRLLMALDAAKGMLYLHAHRPAVLHRDLKSPNLLVARDWRVQGGLRGFRQV
ncbi:MAG: kinase-like domain-containing protein [Monoraphidium minutum]|nr:MAG: kinase-like domain-containing protein [Monoraphidium minutum]